MFRYHVVYRIDHPLYGRPVIGDMVVDRREPLTTTERILALKQHVAFHQTKIERIPSVEWVTILNFIELASRP